MQFQYQYNYYAITTIGLACVVVLGPPKNLWEIM